jgi:nickel-dependent lactate racemase
MAENPLHRELLAIARLARHDFLLDVALTRRREIAAVFAGSPEEAHRQGAEFVAEVMLETLEEPVDAVVTTGAGYPLDLTFYQSIKGITAAAPLVKPGGTILLIGACEEGSGSPEFTRLLSEYRDAGQFLRDIGDRPVIVDQWQLEKLALVKQKADLMFYVPGLDSRFQACLWGPTFPTAPAAVQSLARQLPRGARVAIIPEGPYVLAQAAAAQLHPA